MKKIFLLLIIILTMAACSATEPVSLAGGIYAAEFDQRGESALKYGLNEMGLVGSDYRLSLYKKQIVNGTNHFFVVRVDGISYELKVNEDLSGNLQLKSHKKIERINF